MEELIVKYLTDTLTSGEAARFRALLGSDTAFAAEFRARLAALALADYSLRDSEKDDDLPLKLSELTGQPS